MTTSTINHHRPAPVIAVAAAVAAIAAGAVAFSVSHLASAPAQPPAPIVHTSAVHHLSPPTGGHVILGEL